MNVEETIRTIQFSEIAQKGYKVMSNDEFDMFVDGVLKLQQENKELHNKIDKAIELIESYNLGKYDYSIPTIGIIELLEILKGDVNE